LRFGLGGRRMLCSGHRKVNFTSAVSDGGATSLGSRIGPGTAAHRLRDFAELGSPRISAALCPPLARLWSVPAKQNHDGAVIITWRRVLAIGDDARFNA
jgi:hypothetical protein